MTVTKVPKKNPTGCSVWVKTPLVEGVIVKRKRRFFRDYAMMTDGRWYRRISRYGKDGKAFWRKI